VLPEFVIDCILNVLGMQSSLHLLNSHLC